jgi:hypothetical protein
MAGRHIAPIACANTGKPTEGIAVLTEADAVLLAFRPRSFGGGYGSWIGQRVPITWTPCALGGRRPWFRCEASRNGRCCGRRAAILYSRGGIFACRPCQRLSYECQAETPRLRKIRRARKIRMSLGAGFSFAEPFPDKPPGMHLRRAGNFLPPDIFTVPAFSSKGTRAGGHQSLYGRSGPR